LCKSYRSCFKFYCTFYFTCDRSFTVNKDVCVASRFVELSACIRPYVGWSRCTSDGDERHEAPLASAARRFAVSRRLRDWMVLVQQLIVDCADTRPAGTSTTRLSDVIHRYLRIGHLHSNRIFELNLFNSNEY